MKSWEQLQEDAAEFIAFLQQGNFFRQPFTTTKNYRVITDPTLAMDIAANYAGEQFHDREDAFEYDFPENLVSLGRLQSKLNQCNYFDYDRKSFNGADLKLTCDGVCVLIETMDIDIDYIFRCYFNDYFPELWKEILEIYMNNGFPCGWEGEYPQGRLVVYSNE